MSKPSRSPVILLGVGAIVVLVGLGVRALVGMDDGRAGEMEHIHGLGVDPFDGALYAATHYGLFRVSGDGAATRVSEVQDFMGFTVAGPGRFLASGHPGEGQPGPSSVGLIESTDRGETWATRGLSGEADFHSLEYRHDRVYGLNSMTGELLVGDDLEDWDVRSDLPMADFAVSPDDPDVLLATTQEGLARSTNRGVGFALVEGAPLVVLVSWADDGSVAAVDPEGVLHTSPDGGATWVEGGNLGGPPEALTAHSAEVVYAAANGEVLVSNDGGKTFEPLRQD
jgi:hypothetical protein